MVAVLSILNTIEKGISWLRSVATENQALDLKIKNDLGVLLVKVNSVQWDLRKYEGDAELALGMEDLLLDIQDFICRLSIRRAAGVVDVALVSDPRHEDIARIDYFVSSIRIIQEDQNKAISSGGNATNLPSSASIPYYAPESDLDEGFGKTKSELLDLLSATHDGQLRVVSIVGFNGVGKSALARAVYDEAVDVQSSPLFTKKKILPKPEIDVANAFDCKAWIVAPSTCQTPEHLVMEILRELVDPNVATSGSTPQAKLQNYLQHKRYLIIIDDLRATKIEWKHIHNAFPNNGKNSRIIVTTRVYSIARNYGSSSYHVYPMQYLSKANAEGLFQKKFLGHRSHRILSVPEIRCSRNIVDKCDGLPLALISAGNYLCGKGNHPHLSDKYHLEVCRELDNIVTSDKEAFDEMKRMFVQCYNSLKDYDHKICLLYLSIFPRGHQINCKSFVRRLQAEELVARDVLECLENLIDGSMIDALIRYDCSAAKRFKVQGMILDFIIHKSVSRNLVTLVDKGIVRHNKYDGKYQCQKKVRRLTVHSSSGTQVESSSSTVCAFPAQSACSSEEEICGLTFKSGAGKKEESISPCSCGLTVKSGAGTKEESISTCSCGHTVKSGAGTKEESISPCSCGLTVKSGAGTKEESISTCSCGHTVKSGAGTKEESISPCSCGHTVWSGSIRNDLIPDNIGELSSVRSLTILKSMLLPETWVHFKGCEVMRVLDLEGCTGLTKSSGVLDDICGFPFLKYLSLKNTDADELPTKMKILKHLETLDIRHTRVAILPVEVITLPELAHIYGEFELQLSSPAETVALTKLMSAKKSQLETLAGIVISNTQAFEVIICHAQKLKKLRIYGSMHASASIPTSRSKSGFGVSFTKRKKKHLSMHEPNELVEVLVCSLHGRTSSLESISIDSGAISQAFLASVPEVDSIITSIKLRGKLTSISKSRLLMGLRNLSKLYLFSTCLSSKQLVEPLQILDCLQYLKLSEDDLPGSWEGDFCVKSGGFPALRELCFEGRKKYPRLKIVENAMSILVSLQLLCVESPPRMGVEGIEHLQMLEEVILHHSADDATVQAWKEAAKKHTNMPCVKKQPTQPIRNAA